MAKKSTATRQANAARRSQTTKAPAVALVRANQETSEATQNTGASRAVATASAPAKPFAVAPKPERAPAPAAPKAAARTAPQTEPAARQQAARVQASRVARARATQRARAANVITPEHYGYVINDLRLIAALAVTMFVIIIVLHFVLPQ